MRVLIVVAVVGGGSVAGRALRQAHLDASVAPCVPRVPAAGSQPLAAAPGAVTELGRLCDPSERTLITDLEPQNGGWLVVGRDRPVAWWSADGASRIPLGPHDALSASARGDRLLVGLDAGAVETWSLGSKQRTAELGVPGGPVWDAWWHPGAATELGAAGRGGGVPMLGGGAALVHDGRAATRVDTPAESWCGAPAPDGSVLAICQGSEVGVREPESLELRHTLTTNTAMLWAVAFAPDGTRLAAAGDTAVELFDVATWTRVGTHDVDSTPRDLDWSPDSEVLAIGDWGGQVHLVDREGGGLAHLSDPDRGRIQAAAFSADGRWLATGGDGGLVLIYGVP